MRKYFKCPVLFLILTGVLIFPCHATRVIEFGPQETKIDGSIKYSVIGRYKAHFKDFKGNITVDEQFGRITSVNLEIETDSIQSDCRWCDKIVRSDTLLAAAKYPKISFRSTEILPDKNNHIVKGVLDLHGVKKQMIFPFQIHLDPTSKVLDVRGRWVIGRKDFNIFWSKVLDHGGVLVGDHFTVDWGIKAGIKN